MRPVRALALPFAVLAAAAGIAAGCGGDSEDKWEGETIAIGSIFSTSGAGVQFGPQQLKAVNLAIDEINEDGGLSGAEIVLNQKDDAGDPADAAREMRSLIQEDEVLAVLGPTFSNAAAEADPIADRLRTTVLAVSNTGPGIVGDCPYPCDFIYRDSLGEATAIPANVETFLQANPAETALVVFPPDDPFGADSAEIAVKAFEDRGVRVIDSTSGETAVRSGLARDPDVLLITASSGELAAAAIKSARAEGYRGPILGGNAFNSTDTVRLAGAAGKGAQSAAAWFLGNPSEANRDFVSAYRAAYGRAPDQFAAQAYTGVKLLAAAIEESGLTFDDLQADRKAISHALGEVFLDTPLGEFTFTDQHDVSQPIWIVRSNGKDGFELVKEIPAPEE